MGYFSELDIELHEKEKTRRRTRNSSDRGAGKNGAGGGWQSYHDPDEGAAQDGQPYDDEDLRDQGWLLKATYSYKAPTSEVMFQKLKYVHPLIPGAKKFRQRRPERGGGWLAGTGQLKIPYNWPELVKRPNEPVYWTEGEEDANTLTKLGLLATTSADHNVSPIIAKALKGRAVVVLPDNDAQGRRFAEIVERDLQPWAAQLQHIELPDLGPSEDVTDWLNAGHTVEELLALVSATLPELGPTKLTLIDPASWEGVPVPEQLWAVRPLLPDEIVALLYGDGGMGKSRLALQLAFARATQTKWLDLETMPGRTLILSAEDDAAEMHRRLDAICQHTNVPMGALGDIRVVDLVGQDAVIGELTRNGRIEATELYRFMVKMIASFRPGLVIIDALADSFAGDENNRMQARQFVGMLNRPIRNYRCGFLPIAHPSLSGISSGRGTSGSTGWSNSVRSRMYFEKVEIDGTEVNPDLRRLRLPKGNRTAPGFEMLVRYERGVYVPVKDSEPLDRLAKQMQADEVFLRCLQRLTSQGRYVSDKTGTNFAPAVFSKEPEATEKFISKEQLRAAMVRLFADGQISLQLDTTGPKSKWRHRLMVGM